MRDREDRSVPRRVRQEVIDRDGSCCRVCGRYVTYPALHHVKLRSQGGLNVVDNLVVVGWYGDHDCHLTLAHGPDTLLFRALLLGCVEQPGVTALQLRRQLEPNRPKSANARSQAHTRRLVGWPLAEPITEA